MCGWRRPVEFTNGFIDVFEEHHAIRFHELDALLLTAGWSLGCALSEKAS